MNVKRTLFMLAIISAILALALTAGAQDKKKGPPKGRTQITFEVTPPSATVFVDGKKHGEAGKLTTVGVAVSAGTHAIKLVNKGDEIEADVNVKAGQSLNFRYVFEDTGAPNSTLPQNKDAKDKADKKEKEKEKEKGKKDKDAKDEGKGDKDKKKKEEMIDLPPDNSSKTDEGEKKEESSKPWKKGGGEEEQAE